jgi:uncharacterized membrane protein
MIRIFLGAIAGFLIAAVVVVLVTLLASYALGVEQGETSAAYMAINVIGSLGAAVGGGFAAQRISRREQIIAPFIMAASMFLMTIGSALGDPLPGQPSWYPWVLLIVGPGGALAGGVIATRRPSRPGA